MVTLLHMIHHDTSSQKTRDVILKCERYIFTKCDKSLLETVPRFSLQNVSFITKCFGTENFQFVCYRHPFPCNRYHFEALSIYRLWVKHI